MSAKKKQRTIRIDALPPRYTLGRWGLQTAHYQRKSKRVKGTFDIFLANFTARLFFTTPAGDRRLLGEFDSYDRAKLEAIYYEGEPLALAAALAGGGA